MNKIVLIGNLTNEPDMHTTPNGVSVCRFTIATNRRFADASGNRKTDFFRIYAWRKLGENCGKYLSKGKKVAVIGELQAQTYKDKQGETRISLDVAADEIEFLSQKSENATVAGGRITEDEDFTDVNPDKLPF